MYKAAFLFGIVGIVMVTQSEASDSSKNDAQKPNTGVVAAKEETYIIDSLPAADFRVPYESVQRTDTDTSVHQGEAKKLDPFYQLGKRDLSEPPSSLFKAFGVGMVVAAGGDLVSAELGLRHPGVYETNPLQRNRAVRIGTHTVAPALVYWASERVRRGGRPQMALLVRIGLTVAYSYAVMHNVRTTAGVR